MPVVRGPSFNQEHADAVDKAGGSQAIAARAGITRAGVHLWKVRGRIPDQYLALVDGMLPRESPIRLLRPKADPMP